MTTFEEGYAAYLAGRKDDDNPYDFDEQPYSWKRWLAGWKACRQNRMENAR